MAAKVKEKKKFSFVQLQIIIFTIVGFALGIFISTVYYDQLFELFMAQRLKYVEDDWSRTEYFANRLADQTIALKKLLTDDRIKKVDYAPFDSALDLRSRMIGGDTLDDKVPLLKDFEADVNRIIAYYNSRMDLRNKRFSYREWGMITAQYSKDFEEAKPKYNVDADDFNGKIKIFPYSWVAKKKKYKALPLTEEGKITPVQTATEKYFKPLPGPPREVEGYVPGENSAPDPVEQKKSGGSGGGKKK
jgi:hypothetical protein